MIDWFDGWMIIHCTFIAAAITQAKWIHCVCVFFRSPNVRRSTRHNNNLKKKRYYFFFFCIWATVYEFEWFLSITSTATPFWQCANIFHSIRLHLCISFLCVCTWKSIYYSREVCNWARASIHFAYPHSINCFLFSHFLFWQTF